VLVVFPINSANTMRHFMRSCCLENVVYTRRRSSIVGLRAGSFILVPALTKNQLRLKDYHDLNYPDWNPSGINASASPAEQLGMAAIRLCIRSYGTDRNSMSGSNPCCFRAVQSPVVMLVHPVITGNVIEL
jgi:hypothetical protein